MAKAFKKVLIFLIALVMTVLVQIPETKISVASPEEARKRIDDAIVLYIGSPVARVNDVEKQIDASNAEVVPLVRNNTTLVPVRFITESLGAEVGWDASAAAVTVTLGEKVIKFTIGSNKMLVNGREQNLGAPAEAFNDRTFVPVRALAEALGKKVFYESGLIVISEREEVFNTATEKPLLEEAISLVNTLPTVGTYEKLEELLREASGDEGYFRSGKVGGVLTFDNSERAVDSVQAPRAMKQIENTVAGVEQESNKAKQDDYSKTNVQVQGVDEADVVKTDGEYIYQVNNRRIVVAKAYPADEMEIKSIINFTDEGFSPCEMYLDEKNLVVIGSTYNEVPICRPDVKRMPEIYPPSRRHGTVKVIVYDIADKTQIKKLREVEVDGNYVSSRKIGPAVYLVANKGIYYRYLENQTENITPSYRDTAVKDEFINIDLAKIQYFPGCVHSNYMVVAGLNLDRPNEEVKVSSYLGSGQNVYASLQNMYVAVTRYTRYRYEIMKNTTGAVVTDMPQTTSIAAPLLRPAHNTLVYKFALDDGKATYKCKGEVPGTILNQFSMDEDKGYFRIATTGGDVWRRDEYTSRNNLYVLDDMLNIAGKIEDIAPGEQIYSVRFMGDRGYMVTFKTVDPLFVIDLKDPKNPKILGSLKIPGYSDYLHPYDENHIIGFGKDAAEVAIKDSRGNVIDTMAYYQGMKMAIFDVSDVKNPVEMFSEKIGDRGTESELLRNHKALLFSREKNLLAFPVTVMEVKDRSPDPDTAIHQYGQFAFQGAYVYNIDLADGFRLKGRITHLSDDDYLKAGSRWYGSEKNVERILYIGDTLYTLSKSMFKANALEDLKEKKSLNIPLQ